MKSLKRTLLAAVLPIVCTTGFVAAPVFTITRPVAAVAASSARGAQSAAEEKRMIDAYLPALLKTEEADKLFGEKKWGECLTAVDAAEKIYDNASKRFPDGETKVTVNLTPSDFAASRKYGYVITDKNGFAWQKYGIGKTIDGVVVVPVAGGRVSAGMLRGLGSSMRKVVVALAGKAVLYNDWGGNPPDAIAPKDYYNDARDIARMELPVPDDQWEAVTLLLRRAVLMLDAGVAAKPTLESEYRDNRVGSDMTGAQIRKFVTNKLAQAEKENKTASQTLASEAPAQVENDRNGILSGLDLILTRINNGSYYDPGDAGFVGGYGREQAYANLRKSFGEAYAKEAKTMPADVLKPIQEKIAEVSKVLDQKAPGLHFEAKTPAPAGIANAAKAAVLKAYPGAVVARVGMDDTKFGINRDELGNIVNRTRDGRISYKMPGEKWHRSLLFTYVEAYAGGGSYVAPGRAALGNLLRFESAN